MIRALADDADADSGQISGVVRRVLPDSLLVSLRRALQGDGGEIIVKSGDRTGRIYVTGGAIAWAVCDAVPYRLSHVLQSEAGVGREELKIALGACRVTGENFGETLVAMELIDLHTFRRCLLLHNARQILAISRMSPMISSFEPGERQYSSELLFDLSELLTAAARLLGSVRPPLPPSDILKQAAFGFPDCRALATLRIPEGRVLEVWPRAYVSQSEGIEIGCAVVDLLEGPLGLRLTQVMAHDDSESRPVQIVSLNTHGIWLLASNAARTVAIVGNFGARANLGLILSRLQPLLDQF